MAVCEIDLRVGGKWRWVQRTIADGSEHPLSGEYLEVDRPGRLDAILAAASSASASRGAQASS